MGDVTPICIGCLAAIRTTFAVAMTAVNGNPIANCQASEFGFKESGSRRFFRGKQ
jgi:hypothetical protein